MKKIGFVIIALCLAIAPMLSFGQTITFRLSDLIGQNRKERNNTLAQIAQLQVYIHAARQGYALVKDGLHTIHQIRDGEFSLHDLYYLSKKQVSPAVKRYPAALQVIDQSLQVHRSLDRFLREMNRDTVLNAQQREYFRSTCGAIATDVDKLNGELQTVLTDGQLEMGDAERISRIEQVAARSQQQLLFTKTFCTDARGLVQARLSETIELNVLGNYYNLKK